MFLSQKDHEDTSRVNEGRLTVLVVVQEVIDIYAVRILSTMTCLPTPFDGMNLPNGA